MAASGWKGYLALSLVTCPVVMTPATSGGPQVKLHILNRKTGHRVRFQMVDEVTRKVVADDDQAKGYPIGDDAHVLVEEDEIEALRLPAKRTIAIQTFLDLGELDPRRFDTPYYLSPDDEVGAEAFAVIREAMVRTGRTGIALMVMAGRERLIALSPRGKGLLGRMLRVSSELRDEAAVLGEIEDVKPSADLKRLTTELVASMTGAFDPAMVRDPRSEALQDLIDRKIGRRKGKVPRPKAGKNDGTGNRRGDARNLFEALRRSLDAQAEPKATRPAVAASKAAAAKKRSGTQRRRA